MKKYENMLKYEISRVQLLSNVLNDEIDKLQKILESCIKLEGSTNHRHLIKCRHCGKFTSDKI